MAASCTEIEEDAEVDDMPPVRRVVPATECQTPRISSPRSVFEIAQFPLPRWRMVGAGYQAANEPKKLLAAGLKREPGVTRCEGASYPVRWTAVDFDRERARRARQRPPKPTKRAKTRGKKLRDLIGDIFDD
jgi:hypothetical protein